MTIMIMTMVSVDDYDYNSNNMEDTRRYCCNNNTYNDYSTWGKDNKLIF